jgi:hypothetical protein
MVYRSPRDQAKPGALSKIVPFSVLHLLISYIIHLALEKSLAYESILQSLFLEAQLKIFDTRNAGVVWGMDCKDGMIELSHQMVINI